MSELIDRSVLRARMYSEAFESDTDMQRWDSGCWIRYKLFEKVVDNMPTVPYSTRWYRVEEPPKESGKQYAVWASKGYAYCDKWLGDRWLISSVAPETVTHWMPIEPPKEDT